MAPLLELKDITRTFGSGKNKITAVDSLSLAIEEGEIVCLVGESGCGKSTTGGMAAGLLPVSAGQILFDGQDITKMDRTAYRKFRHSVQIVHQDPYASLNPTQAVERVAEQQGGVDRRTDHQQPDLARQGAALRHRARAVGGAPDGQGVAGDAHATGLAGDPAARVEHGPAAGRELQRVLERGAAVFRVFLTLGRLLRLQAELEALVVERKALENEVLEAVNRFLPADMERLFHREAEA